MADDPRVEAVARAIFEADRDFYDAKRPDRHFKVAIALYQAMARAALAAAYAHGGAREAALREAAEFIRVQRNETPATGEEFAVALLSLIKQEGET